MPVSLKVFVLGVVAIGALRAIRASGRSVPADVSVVGFDDIDLAAYGIADFSTLLAATTDVGGNAVIALGGGYSVTLTGVFRADLGAGDFIL